MNEVLNTENRTPNDWVCIALYPSHGKRYYRLMWGFGCKNLGQLHVPGGGSATRTAKGRAEKLKAAIASGRTVAQLKLMIQRWKQIDARKRGFVGQARHSYT